MRIQITENQLKLIVEDKKKSKKDEKTPKKDQNKGDFDRVSYYLDYYKNLTPKDFDICKKGDNIIISIPERK
jgi:hypothetical protein